MQRRLISLALLSALTLSLFAANAASAAPRPVIIDITNDGDVRAFGPPNDLTGVTKLSVRGRNLPTGATLRWSIPRTAIGRYTITQTTTAGTSEVTIAGIQPGRTDIDFEAVDAKGVVVASMKLPLSIPQFFTIDDTNPDLDAFMTNNNLVAIQSQIMNEARGVVELLHNTNANVRLIWKSQGTSIPAHLPAAFVTTARIGNTDVNPAGPRYGTSDPGLTSTVVGDTEFDESILIFPQSYLAAGGATSDVNTAVNELVRAVNTLQSSDSDYELWLIRIFGRLIGETLAHEMFHALLPVPFFHNSDGTGADIETSDIMDSGSFRSLVERTGIVAVSSLSANLFANLSDLGTGSINRLSGANLTFVQTHFPVPPVKPFDR